MRAPALLFDAHVINSPRRTILLLAIIPVTLLFISLLLLEEVKVFRSLCALYTLFLFELCLCLSERVTEDPWFAVSLRHTLRGLICRCIVVQLHLLFLAIIYADVYVYHIFIPFFVCS